MDIAPPRRKRRLVSLTPMIDVVFLLLIFFMLASRFTTERAIALSGGESGTGAVWEGAPRLLEIAPDALRFNGEGVALEGLAGALTRAGATPDRPILLRLDREPDVQRLTDVLDALAAAGFERPVLLP